MQKTMHYEVIIDSGEKPNKCTIAPLSYRPDFSLYPVKGKYHLGPLHSTILLHHQGECLTSLRDRIGPVKGIATIDCVWRRLDGLLRRVQGGLPLLARIPDGFVTAYPRRSEKNTDPDGGLATIEAIFVAAALLGHWDPTLLSEYYFGRQFIELNQKRLLELGIREAADTSRWPVLSARLQESFKWRQKPDGPTSAGEELP